MIASCHCARALLPLATQLDRDSASGLCASVLVRVNEPKNHDDAAGTGMAYSSTISKLPIA